MEVSQEYLRHISRVDRQLGHSSRHPTAAINQELLRSCQNQRTDTKSLRPGPRPPSRPEQEHSQTGVACWRDRPLRFESPVRKEQEQKAKYDGTGFHLASGTQYSRWLGTHGIAPAMT